MGRVTPCIPSSRSCSLGRNRLGADPRNTNYAGGNTSAKGTDTDPVTGDDVELLWVKGSGGDLGTLTEAGLAVLRLDRLRALVDVYPGRGARRRDGRRVRLLPARQGRRGAVDRHRDARAGRRRARRPPPPRQRHRHRHRRRRRATHQGDLRRAGSRGCRGVAPASSSDSTSRRSTTRNPTAVGVILGGHGITAWGATSAEAEANSRWIIEHRAGVPRRARLWPSRSAPTVPERVALPSDRTAREGGGARAAPARRRVARPPHGRPLHRLRRRPRVPGRREALRARRARHVVSGPLPAHEGEAARAGPARRRRRSTSASPDSANCTSCTAPTTARTTSGTPTPTRRRCAAPTRRSSSCPASGCSPTARTSRPRVSPASSTSTRST